MIFSFFSTLATLSIGAKVGMYQGRGVELAIIAGGLVATLGIGFFINQPDKKTSSDRRKDEKK